MRFFRLIIGAIFLALTAISSAQKPINGPWLWLFSPLEESQTGKNNDIDMDQISNLSQGKLTEKMVSQNGVGEGDSIGLQVWKTASIPNPQHPNNIGLIAKKIGIDSPQFENQRTNSLDMNTVDLDNFSAYAFAKIVSDSNQPKVSIRVGSDDAIKVWLNGEVVHKNMVLRSSYGFQDVFEINLHAGDNNLLIKVLEVAGDWSLNVGIQAKFTIGNNLYRPITEIDSLKWFDPTSLVEMGNIDQAIYNYERLIESNFISSSNFGIELFNLTNLYQQKNLEKEGIKFLESIVNKRGKSTLVWSHLIKLNQAINDQQKIAAIQNSLIADFDPTDFDAGMAYGQILMETETFDQATLVYEKLFVNFPDRPYMLWDLQHAYRQSGGTEKAIEGFEKLLESHPNHTELLSQIIQLYRETNNQQKITNLRNRLLSNFNAQDPDVSDPERGVLYGELLSEDGRHQEAQKIYEALVEADPNNIYIKQNLIQSYRSTNQDKKVKDLLDRMLDGIRNDSYKNNPSLIAFCVEIMIDFEEFEEAQTQIEKLLDVWPDQPGPMELMAKLHDGMGETDKADEYRIMSDPGQKLVGLTAADFQLEDLDGNQVSLSQFEGHPVILNFWATW